MTNVPSGTSGGKTLRRKRKSAQTIVADCLGAFIRAGTIELPLDQLANKVKVSKRMLIHYFGGREAIEEKAMTLLENRLRVQFSPQAFPKGTKPEVVINALWNQATAAEAKGVLLLLMDLSRRAWQGSARAKAFYAEQQRLWVELLLKFLPDRAKVEEILQLFQGSVLAYLITGDREPGRRALLRTVTTRQHPSASVISRANDPNRR